MSILYLSPFWFWFVVVASVVIFVLSWWKLESLLLAFWSTVCFGGILFYVAVLANVTRDADVEGPTATLEVVEIDGSGANRCAKGYCG